MFQDEARFGRLPVIRAAWAPVGIRPLVPAAVERQFKYAYAAITPEKGQIDWMISDKMNTENMDVFLEQIRETYPEDFILMVVDGASSHTTKKLYIPDNMALLSLPPYSPELNPVECLWDYLRKKVNVNCYHQALDDVVGKVEVELAKLSSRGERQLSFNISDN